LKITSSVSMLGLGIDDDIGKVGLGVAVTEFKVLLPPTRYWKTSFDQQHGVAAQFNAETCDSLALMLPRGVAH
jgi:hypothetical protein